MTENSLILKRTVTYTSEDASRGTGGIGYEVIPYPEPTIEPDANKESPTITLTPATMDARDLGVFFLNPGYHDIDISYNGDGTLYVDYIIYDPRFSNFYCYGQTAKIINDNGYKLRLYSDFRMATTDFYPDETLPVSFTVRATATDTCNQASATFTITD